MGFWLTLSMATQVLQYLFDQWASADAESVTKDLPTASQSQAILKFCSPSNLDYRACHGPQNNGLQWNSKLLAFCWESDIIKKIGLSQLFLISDDKKLYYLMDIRCNKLLHIQSFIKSYYNFIIL